MYGVAISVGFVVYFLLPICAFDQASVRPSAVQNQLKWLAGVSMVLALLLVVWAGTATTSISCMGAVGGWAILLACDVLLLVWACGAGRVEGSGFDVLPLAEKDSPKSDSAVGPGQDVPI